MPLPSECHWSPPGTVYEMALEAASQEGGIVAKSLASDSVMDSTDVTGQLINKVDHMY